MTTNCVASAGLISNTIEKTLRSNAPELKELRSRFHRIGECSVTKFILGHALRENNLTKRITSLLFGERKKKEDAFEQL